MDLQGAMPPGYRLVTFGSIGSTNTQAMQLAGAGDPGNVWLIADEQVRGRGRSGRVWASVPGNLYASLLLRLACGPETAQQLALLAGVAVIDAIRTVSDLGSDTVAPLVRKVPTVSELKSDTSSNIVPKVSDQRSDSNGLRLKWPNDILIGSAKLGGILLESARGLGGPGLVAVIGFGLNVAGVPEGLARSVTSLAAAGCRLDREAMLAALAAAMDRRLTIWSEGAGFSQIRAAWQDYAGPVGEALVVNTGAGTVAGRYGGLDTDGALLLTDGLGVTRRFTYGDVTLAGLGSEQ